MPSKYEPYFLLNPADSVQSRNLVSRAIAARVHIVLGWFQFLELGFVRSAPQLLLGHKLSR